MFRLTVFAGLVAMVLTVACGGSSDGTSRTPEAPTAGACPATQSGYIGQSQRVVISGGMTRSYRLFIPPNYQTTRPTPLVFEFHAAGSGAESMAGYTGLEALGMEDNFIVVTPQGDGEPKQWDVRDEAGAPDDVGFVRDLLAQLDSQLCIDPNRIYATGWGNGADMALRLACDMPETFAAVAAVSASYLDCTAPLPLIAFHGTADRIVPFEGGEDPTRPGVTIAPIEDSVAAWAAGLDCDATPQTSSPASEVELTTYLRCRFGDGAVQLYAVRDGGHAWPGSEPLPEASAGTTTQEIDASALIWAFFEAHSRPD